MIGAHAGGIIRAVVLTVGPAQADRRPPTTSAREWDADEHRGRRGCSTKNWRASVRRVARRRAAKGYHYAEARKL